MAVAAAVAGRSCRVSQPGPEAAVRDMLQAAKTGDRDTVFELLTPSTQARLEAEAKRATDLVGAAVRYTAKDLVSIGSADSTTAPTDITVHEERGDRAVVEIISPAGRARSRPRSGSTAAGASTSRTTAATDLLSRGHAKAVVPGRARRLSWSAATDDQAARRSRSATRTVAAVKLPEQPQMPKHPWPSTRKDDRRRRRPRREGRRPVSLARGREVPRGPGVDEARRTSTRAPSSRSCRIAPSSPTRHARAVLLRRGRRADPPQGPLLLHAQARRQGEDGRLLEAGRDAAPRRCCSIRTRGAPTAARASAGGGRATTASSSRTRSRRTTPTRRRRTCSTSRPARTSPT